MRASQSAILWPEQEAGRESYVLRTILNTRDTCASDSTHPGALFLTLRHGLLETGVAVLFGLCRGCAPCLGGVFLLLIALFRFERLVAHCCLHIDGARHRGELDSHNLKGQAGGLCNHSFRVLEVIDITLSNLPGWPQK